MLLKEPTKKQEDKIIKSVLREFKKYHRCLLVLEENQLPKITASYTYNESSTVNNQFHSSTESTAIANIEAQEFITSLLKRIDRLKPRYRKIIYEYYIKTDEPNVIEISNMLHVTESHFHRLKRNALITLGYALGYATEEIDSDSNSGNKAL
ncbi:ArpU family phage packaging/lysis transcriptional regulator [Bacillus licheniformis]|uniref:ArpU family phage packaging/lysis transcriptional regulator n=1 Tax=Bacillus licheniformis TaxID=1402 RepID=UPI00092B703A|nr:ArpU family phage packaging/lysis transcriptional regulator [Bacillus licheniformis]OJT69236.1 ArpU family transcriptional regulator [Bacillus licheniformis]